MFRKKNHLREVVLVAVVLIAQLGFAQSQYRFQHFDTRDGLADNYVWSIGQDSLGYMWFQYYGGLTRYDGYNFKVYKYDKDDSLRSSLDFMLAGIMPDDNKNIWITNMAHPRTPPFILLKYDQKTDGFVKFVLNLDVKFINRFRYESDSRTLWLSMDAGKGLNALNMETKELTTYLNPSSDKSVFMEQNSIRDSEDIGSSVLMATSNGLWSFEKATKTFGRPPCNPKDSTFVYHTNFNYIFKKINNSIWTLVPNGVAKLGPDFSLLQHYTFPAGFNLSSITIDANEVFWLGTWTEGLYRFNPSDSSLVNIRSVPGDPFSLPSNSINNVKIDRDQNVWVATPKGVSKLHRKTLQSVNHDNVSEPGTIYKTRDKEFVVTFKVAHRLPLNSFELHLAQILPGQVGLLPPQRLNTPPIEAVVIGQCLQGKRKFWVGTFPSGIFAYSINPDTQNIEERPPQHFFPDSTNPDNTINSAGISSLFEDAEENLWMASIEGLYKILPKIPYGEKGSVKIYKHLDGDTSSILGNSVFQIYPEDDKSFWVLTNNGVDLFNQLTEKFEHIVKGREMPNNLFRTSDGALFLGTLNGLYEARKVQGRYRFDGPALWDRSEVKSIQEDRLGRLWLHSATGLTCYDRKEKVAIDFNEDDGVLHIRNINVGMLHQTSHGVMFTVNKGTTLFDPMTLEIDRKETNPVLTKLLVDNNAPVVGNDSGGDDDVFLIATDISVLDRLTIDHWHNNFTIEYSAMEMTAPEKNLYKHKLEGYDKVWIESDFRNRTATYTNLDPGHYTFKVKASNHHGIWSDVETTLEVTVLPPPWKTAWAYFGYTMIFGLLLVAARKSIVQRERLKSNLKLAKIEQEKEHFELEKAKEVDKVKSTFFANISHEFRTPLTLIKGPVQEMLEDFAEHPKVRQRMNLVQRNADLVLKLINQLLDLAKLESGTLTIEKSENDINTFLSVVTNSFSSLAFQKNITLETVFPETRYLVNMDKDKVETILINLINNALKFTQPGGVVTVRTAVTTQQVSTQLQSVGTLSGGEGRLPAEGFAKAGGEALTLIVSDTGIGIPLDQQARVFERFHQVSESHKEVGTGIGLSLVKELVNLMKGSLSLKSEPGKGSEFKVVLPVEVVASDLETNNVETQQPTTAYQSPLTSYLLPNDDNFKTEEDISKPRILVVEDNGDLRKFIIDCLGKEFQFLEAADGKQGIETAFEETPDLIISDVMMPEMDGITMTDKLKKDARTSHIPLILLTAKTSDESKLSGLGTGADDYLTKPFNKNELLLKVRNSIAARTKLREKIKLELLKESPKVEVQSEDEKFLYKVRETILNRLSDEQLSVESLAEEIGLSRSQLLRKITALTGTSVNELIRTFRLQKAAQLLEQNWGPVTQIAYEVGFSNLSYFSKVFKEQYGVIPSEYPVKTV